MAEGVASCGVDDVEVAVLGVPDDVELLAGVRFRQFLGVVQRNLLTSVGGAPLLAGEVRGGDVLGGGESTFRPLGWGDPAPLVKPVGDAEGASADGLADGSGLAFAAATLATGAEPVHGVGGAVEGATDRRTGATTGHGRTFRGGAVLHETVVVAVHGVGVERRRFADGATADTGQRLALHAGDTRLRLLPGAQGFGRTVLGGLQPEDGVFDVRFLHVTLSFLTV